MIVFGWLNYRVDWLIDCLHEWGAPKQKRIHGNENKSGWPIGLPMHFWCHYHGGAWFIHKCQFVYDCYISLRMDKMSNNTLAMPEHRCYDWASMCSYCTSYWMTMQPVNKSIQSMQSTNQSINTTQYKAIQYNRSTNTIQPMNQYNQSTQS